MREAGAPALGRIVIDASVLVAAITREPDRSSARQFLVSPPSRPIAPDVVLIESASAFLKRIRRGDWSPDDHAEAMALLQNADLDLVPIRLLYRAAAQLSVTLRHPVYDCTYLAVAQEREATLATFDDELGRRARDFGLDVWMG